MAEVYTGVKVVDVAKDIIDEVYREKKVSVEKLNQRFRYDQNMFVVIKNGSSQSAVCRVKGRHAHLLRDDLSIQGIRPKNKEQQMAMNLLLDDSVEVVALTGRAGTGKTLCTLAAAIEKVQKGVYEKILLTRPMSNVGKHSLGALPGDENEKFAPYLSNYMNNLEFLVGKKSVHDLIQQSKMEFIPIQLIRGASWVNAFVIADEIQTLDNHEMVTLGTRVAHGSKLVIMGDLAQRDEKIERKSTGLYRYINHDLTKAADFVGSIDLIQCERGKVAAHFSDVFDAK